MIVPICLVFWSDQLRHSDPINIHVDYSHSVFCSEHIVCLSILSSVPLTSIARKCCHLPYGPPSTALSVVEFKLLQSSKINRIVFDCFYFTQAITLCLLVLFQQSPSTLGVFTHSAPLTTTVSNNPQYMNVAVPILKLLSIVTCYRSIIVHFVLVVTIFWQN